MASTPAAVGADPPPSAASSSATTSSAPEQNLGTTEKLLLGGELFPIPGALFADVWNLIASNPKFSKILK